MQSAKEGKGAGKGERERGKGRVRRNVNLSPAQYSKALLSPVCGREAGREGKRRVEKSPAGQSHDALATSV